MVCGGPKHVDIIRVTTDDAIEGYDVGPWQRGSHGREIGKLELNSPGVPEPRGLLGGGGKVGGRSINVGSTVEAVLQEDVMNGADAPTDVQECRPRRERTGLHRREHLSSGRRGPAAAKASEIPPGDGGIELLVRGTTVARGHRSRWAPQLGSRFGIRDHALVERKYAVKHASPASVACYLRNLRHTSTPSATKTTSATPPSRRFNRPR